jgi:hypothetical protein
VAQAPHAVPMGFDQLNPTLNLEMALIDASHQRPSSSWICEVKATPTVTDVVLYLANPSIMAFHQNVVEQHAQPIVE